MQSELPFDGGQKPAPEPARDPAPKPKRPRAPRKPRPPERADMRLTFWLALLIVIADQALKYWVVHVLRLDRLREIDVLPPWLNLRMAWNQGVNFGLFASDQDIMRWVLIAVAAAICLWVWYWVWRSAQGLVARIAAGLLIGGAIGNVIDRLWYGAVADFLNMSLPGWQNPYSFNVADISIFAGAVGLILIPQKRPDAPKSGRGSRRTGTDKTRDEAGKSR
ncbi:signal peptidase II [Paracoccus siganidrum]|nr:signal peptidase II [Paracoccus siganidrum]